MAELARWKMRRNGQWWDYRHRGKLFCMTENDLRRLFDFPIDAESLEISLYSRVAEDRVKCRVETDHDVFDEKPFCYPVICTDEQGVFRCELTGEAIDAKLKPLIGRTVYLQLEYVEKEKPR